MLEAALRAWVTRLMGLLPQEVKGLFPTIEDYMWFQLALIRAAPSVEGDSPLSRQPGGTEPATLDTLQHYLQQYPASHYSHQGAYSRLSTAAIAARAASAAAPCFLRLTGFSHKASHHSDSSQASRPLSSAAYICHPA